MPGCGGEAVAFGLCARHYMRMRRHGDPNVVRTYAPAAGSEGVEIVALRRRVKELEAALRKAAATRRKALAAIHPDRETDPAVRRRLEEAFKILNDSG